VESSKEQFKFKAGEKPFVVKDYGEGAEGRVSDKHIEAGASWLHVKSG